MKIRSSYISNSSSSSFVISCKGQKLAEYVEEAYHKLFDLWMELNPNDNGYGLNRNNYHIASIQEISDHFEKNYMSKEDIKYNIESMKKEEKAGYVFILGNCASDNGTPEYDIMSMFNEYLIKCLQGRYDWKNEKYKNDISIIFEQRWS